MTDPAPTTAPAPASPHDLAWYRLALAAFLLLGAANVAQDALRFSKLFILLPAAAGILLHLRRTLPPAGERLARWGLRRDNLAPAARAYGSAALAGAALVALAARALGHTLHPDRLLLILLLYPLWAFLQQFCFQVLLRQILDALRVPAAAKLLLVAALFSAVHAPDLPLMALTLLAGAFWTWLYGRIPNLPALALCHAAVGGLAFVWLLDRDPASELAKFGLHWH
ncbi:MAG: CPBP family intramembrane metalloprotease [Planctomycetes bacterium]|nr:CPBP family intramembrane metalloprotease [Planctomycetota bacterium]